MCPFYDLSYFFDKFEIFNPNVHKTVNLASPTHAVQRCSCTVLITSNFICNSTSVEMPRILTRKTSQHFTVMTYTLNRITLFHT